MAMVKNYCAAYARDFLIDRYRRTAPPSLLFLGNTGLGKTHLSLAIAGQVIEKGYGVVYGSAQNLLGKLEKEKFSFNTQDEDQQSYLSLVLECDLLILDDLGTEFLSNPGHLHAIILSIHASWKGGRPSSAPTLPSRRSASATPTGWRPDCLAATNSLSLSGGMSGSRARLGDE